MALLAVIILALLVLPCVPTPRASAQEELPKKWYFAEGTTREGFFEYICLQNSSEFYAHVSMTYMTNDGDIGPFKVVVPPISRDTVLVNAYLEEGLDVSALVESDVGVVVERPMYFYYKGMWAGGHVAMGVNGTSDTWYFAEGTTRSGFEEWLCLQNPQDDEVAVKVYFYSTSAVQDETYRIDPRHRLTVNVNEEVARFWPEEPEQDVSLKVEASGGVVAERPMYFAYMGDWEGGDTVVGATQPGREWYLAEGYCQWNFDTWLCFLNPGQETAHVHINYRRSDGVLLPTQDLLVAGFSRQTVCVNDVAGFGEFSFHITSDQDIIVERPIYFSYKYMWVGGHDNKGVEKAREAWYLAEGSTRKGIETYLCILNPLDVGQSVTVEYLMKDGGYKAVDFEVPAYSRSTRNVNADVGEGRDVSFLVRAFTNSEPVRPGSIVVERPMYFLYGGTIAGGHVTSGFPPPSP